MKKFEKLFWAGVGYLVIFTLVLLVVVAALINKHYNDAPERVVQQEILPQRVDTVIKIVEVIREEVKPEKKAKTTIPQPMPTIKDTVVAQIDTTKTNQ